MALIVQKFGGTSVGDIERIHRVSSIVSNAREEGHDVVVVVSAMEGETDRLISLAKTISESPSAREIDALVSTGEQVSAALVSMSLNAQSCPARSYSAFQVSIKTGGPHQKAEIKQIQTEQILADVAEGYVPVITGYQGVSDSGHVTTIGRGGSDITAVALAAALKADECQIFTDVDGVYTSDPRVVREARLLKKVSFDEMLELSTLGAKVLHARAVQFAFQYRVPLRVLSTFSRGEGTLVTVPEEVGLVRGVSGVVFDGNQAKITIIGFPKRSETLSELMQSINQSDVDVDMMMQSVTSSDDVLDFSFTVTREGYQEAMKMTQELADRFSAKEVLGDKKMAKLSVVGLGIKSHAGIAAKMFQSLSEKNIPIQLIISSEIKISTLLNEKYLELGAKVLHSAFKLEKTK